jgi:hypothetical protein
LISCINATPISTSSGAIDKPHIFNESIGLLSLKARQNFDVWNVTYSLGYAQGSGWIANPVEVCQGTTALNPWISGKSICTWTFLWTPSWGRKCNMYMFDQGCVLIGKNLGQVTLDDLANPVGWGFSSELPDFVVINIPSDPISVVSNNVTFWYDGEEYMLRDGIPTNYNWLFKNNFSWSGTYGIFTVIRTAFAC